MTTDSTELGSPQPRGSPFAPRTLGDRHQAIVLDRTISVLFAVGMLLREHDPGCPEAKGLAVIHPGRVSAHGPGARRRPEPRGGDKPLSRRGRTRRDLRLDQGPSRAASGRPRKVADPCPHRRAGILGRGFRRDRGRAPAVLDRGAGRMHAPQAVPGGDAAHLSGGAARPGDTSPNSRSPISD